MLLTGLQREPVCRCTVGIDGDAHQPAGHRAGEGLGDRDEPGVRATEPHRHAESLSRADAHVGTLLPRRCDERAGEQVGGGRGQDTLRVRGRDQLGVVAHGAVSGRVLQQNAEDVRVGQPRGGIEPYEVDAERFGPRLQDRPGLGEHTLVHSERVHVLLATVGPAQERHRLDGRSPFVQQRRTGDREPGEVLDDGLEVQERLEPALGDLRLVGRVRGVPARVLQDSTSDDARSRRAVVALADHRGPQDVPARDRAEFLQHAVLGGRTGQSGGASARFVDVRRDRRAHHPVEGVVADRLEHHSEVGRARADVSPGELARIERRLCIERGSSCGHGNGGK